MSGADQDHLLNSVEPSRREMLKSLLAAGAVLTSPFSTSLAMAGDGGSGGKKKTTKKKAAKKKGGKKKGYGKKKAAKKKVPKKKVPKKKAPKKKATKKKATKK